MFDSEIMQATSDFHDTVGKAIAGIAQDVLDNSTAFDATNGMFNSHPDSR